MISYIRLVYHIWYHMWYNLYHIWYKRLIWYHNFLCDITHDIIYDIMYDMCFTCLWVMWYGDFFMISYMKSCTFPWYHMTQRQGKTISHMTSYMMSCNFAWYHHYVISHNGDIIELYDVICDITCLAGLGRRLTWTDIVAELGQLIDLDQYSLDSLIDLVAFYTVSTVNRGFLEVIEEG